MPTDYDLYMESIQTSVTRQLMEFALSNKVTIRLDVTGRSIDAINSIIALISKLGFEAVENQEVGCIMVLKN